MNTQPMNPQAVNTREHLLTHAEPRLQRRLKTMQPRLLAATTIEQPALLRADGGPVDNTARLAQLKAGFLAAEKAGDKDGMRILKAEIDKVTPPVDVPADVGKGIASGLEKGTVQTLAIPGDIATATGNAAGWVAGFLKAPPDQQKQIAQAVRKYFPVAGALPNSAEMQRLAENAPVIGDTAKDLGNFEPKSGYGQVAQGVSELVPGAVTLSGAGDLRSLYGAMIKFAGVPYLTGKGLEEAAPDKLKPWAKTIGEMGGAVGAQAGANAARWLTTDVTEALRTASTGAPPIISRILDTAMQVGEKGQPPTNADIQNKIRQGLANLAIRINSDPNGVAAQFTPAEREAIQRVADGRPVENLQNKLGDFTPGFLSMLRLAGWGATLGGGAGFALTKDVGAASTLGTIAAAAAPVVATGEIGARTAANLRTAGNIRNLANVINPAIPPAVSVGRPNPFILGDYLPKPPSVDDYGSP